MQLLRSLAYALIFYPATALFVIAGIVTTIFGQDATRALVRSWTDFHDGLARVVLGISAELQGDIPKGAVLIAVKHGAAPYPWCRAKCKGVCYGERR